MISYKTELNAFSTAIVSALKYVDICKTNLS